MKGGRGTPLSHANVPVVPLVIVGFRSIFGTFFLSLRLDLLISFFVRFAAIVSRKMNPRRGLTKSGNWKMKVSTMAGGFLAGSACCSASAGEIEEFGGEDLCILFDRLRITN